MTNYKITNITNLIGKREKDHNLPLEITVSEGMIPRKMKIIPGGFVILKANKLPLSVHSSRIRGLVEVTQVSDEEVKKLEKPNIGKKKKKVEAVKTTTTTKAPKKTSRRKKIDTTTTTKIEKKEGEE